MKKILFVASCFFLTTVHAQKPAPKKTTVSKTVTTSKSTSGSPLKNLTDSASYAIGLSVAQFYLQQGVAQLNTTVLAKAMSDVFAKRSALLTDHQLNDIIMKYMEKTQMEKSKPTVTASENFLAQNKTKPGIKTTASGLQYEILRDAQGLKPAATDTVVVNYAGTLIDGTEFDNSYKRGQPIEFPLNRVIKGWTEGVQLMPVGSKFKFYIPYELGYGIHGNGSIPGGAALIFEVELLSIKGK